MSDGAGIRAWISVYLKGVCMGAADTVPGVSGGTIAVVLGIYERLITALTELDPAAVRHLPALHTAEGRGALRSEFRRADVPFLSVLGFGVLSAAATVATAMNAAVTRYPAPTSAFFFGLIGASAVALYRYVEIGTLRRLLVAVAGASLAFLLTDPALATTGTATLPALFLAGAIAISAMILPGVSGAFLLLVLGQYEYVSGIPRRVAESVGPALNGDAGPLVDASVPLAAFAAGAVVGLFSVAYAVRAALERHRAATFTFLVSLMVGALRLPAREVVENAPGLSVAGLSVVVAPALCGAAAVLVLDRYTEKLQY